MDAAQWRDGGGIDPTWDAWRTRALNVLLTAICILGLPYAIPGISGAGGVSPDWQWLATAVYLLLLVVALRPGWGFRVRSRMVAVLAYAAAGVALANRGLVGYGRMGLAVYPCCIMVLMGTRAGWSAVGASLGMYGAYAGLALLGATPDTQAAWRGSATPAFWIMQGLTLALAMLPTVVLLARFRVHYMRTLAIERQMSRRLQAEIAQRTAAHESLDREQAERTLLEEKIGQLGEEERRQLGREIHDGLCQQLTAALLRCTALQEQLGKRQAEEAAQAQHLGRLIQEMLDDAYAISKGVWPVGPEPDDLVPAVGRLAKRTAEEFGLACEFRHAGEIVLPDGQTAMHLYRIAQEAVTNAVKHAKASRIIVSLQGDAEGIVLTVSDNGCGLPDESRSGGGMGLSIMSYRARSIGGALAVGPAEGGGTVVSCRAPVQMAALPKGASGASGDGQALSGLCRR